jgi:hypothetical protein
MTLCAGQGGSIIPGLRFELQVQPQRSPTLPRAQNMRKLTEV